MTREKLSISLLILMIAFALVVPLIGGSLVQDYSHVQSYISELGAVGTEWGKVVSLGGFLPIGLLVITFLVVNAPLVNPIGYSKIGYYLLLFVGASYIGAAFAPCDIGCPAEGSLRQNIHNLLGIFEYLIGGVGLLMFSMGFRKRTKSTFSCTVLAGLGILTIVSFFLMASVELSSFRGLFQRIAELCLFTSFIILGWPIAMKVTSG
ncbi:MAG: hypothetical protein COA96_03205 [SAR86 cluster bacterium]|uniref:DUF998 domain-containing protein n=1 Tax=SAR86 cluster bacterium TaxID=2030880 RepID=A0A2A5B865_9GAMM|nr:MAG: hypothetical protein COA96_03205 [SAR86 cluster bacterium]